MEVYLSDPQVSLEDVEQAGGGARILGAGSSLTSQIGSNGVGFFERTW
jgi:hypothetical protein